MKTITLLLCIAAISCDRPGDVLTKNNIKIGGPFDPACSNYPVYVKPGYERFIVGPVCGGYDVVVQHGIVTEIIKRNP